MSFHPDDSREPVLNRERKLARVRAGRAHAALVFDGDDRLERHDDEFFLAIRLYSEGPCETKESPMRSVWVDLTTEDRRPLRPDGLKPC